MQFLGCDTANVLHHVGRHTNRQIGHTHYHHLRHSSGQGQHQFEVGALTRHGSGLDPAADTVDFGANHVHADSAPRQFRHLGSSGKARHKDKVGRILVAERLTGSEQPKGYGFFANPLEVQTGAVIAELD